MLYVVLLESVEENFAINFPGTQFQAQKVTMNFLGKSGLLGHIWTRNAKRCHVLTERKLKTC
jgi:hypothetical protein